MTETTELTSMPNQARTLLLNRDGDTRPTAAFFGEEYVPPSFKAVELPSELLTVRRALFGSNPDNAGMNYMLWHYMRLLHSTEYSSYVMALDTRITYMHKRSLIDYEFGPGITPDDDALDFSGGSSLGGADGRLYASWRITYSGGVEITNLQTGFSELQTPVVTDGLTNFMPLTGMSSLLVRIRVPLTATSWVVEYLEQPTSELDPITRAEQLGSIGDEAYAALFPNRAPYKLFKQLWEQHSEFPYKISGALLALVYLTEEYRTTLV